MRGNGGRIKRIYGMTVKRTDAWSSGIHGTAVPNKKLVPNYGETAHHVDRVIPLNGRPGSAPDCTVNRPRIIRGGSTSGGVRPENGVEQRRPGCQQRSSSIR